MIWGGRTAVAVVHTREAQLIRAALAVIVGFVVWFLVATVGNLLNRALMPGYAAVEPSMAFTLSMLIGRLAIGLVSSGIAGFVCSAIARQRRAAIYFFAVALLIFFLPAHYNLWAKFPVWYHIVFLGSLAPFILLGAIVHRSHGVRTGGAP